jgi:hypothetical protein
MSTSSELKKAGPVVNISLAAFPGMRHEQATERAVTRARAGELNEKFLGVISTGHIQLVPQNFGLLSESLVDDLMDAYPEVQLRLHANVRVQPSHRVADLANFGSNTDWFECAAAISKRIRAPAYTAHSGLREDATMTSMLDNARRASDLFGCPVGVEGQYPVPGNTLLVSSWDEYRQVFESGCPYALDLSHLNIVVHQSGRREDNLVREMLSCDRCIEVHLSDNEGQGDSHQVCESQTWWYPLLGYINEKTVVFTEGNHLRKVKKCKI